MTAGLAQLIAGAALLILGRKLFWFFVGVAGFLAGMYFATNLFPGLSQNAALIVGIIAGLIGIFLAILLRRIAIAVAGFFAGGYLLAMFAGPIGSTGGTMGWILFVVGGIIGAILFSAIFDWALIIVSSLVGATLIIQYFHLTQSTASLLIILLTIVGIVIQARLLRGEEEPVRRERVE